MSKTVHDLRSEEIEELKNAMYYEEDADEIRAHYAFPHMIDDTMCYEHYSDAEYDATKTVWDEWHKDEEISIEAVHAWRMAHYGYDCDND